MIKVRSLARKVGLIGIVNRLRPSSAYEMRVRATLGDAVRPGDVVWDVGANVGVYSELFCQWVGKDGRVVAFEPWAESCQRIRERLPDCPWLKVENVALGEVDGTGVLIAGAESTENHLATEADVANRAAGTASVAIFRGDTLRHRLGHVPNVIKVDVEGFEVEVLAGIDQLLGSPELRSLMIEVHFSKLERRGKLTAPEWDSEAPGEQGIPYAMGGRVPSVCDPVKHRTDLSAARLRQNPALAIWQIRCVRLLD